MLFYALYKVDLSKNRVIKALEYPPKHVVSVHYVVTDEGYNVAVKYEYSHSRFFIKQVELRCSTLRIEAKRISQEEYEKLVSNKAP